jgi:hypothetical protein
MAAYSVSKRVKTWAGSRVELHAVKPVVKQFVRESVRNHLDFLARGACRYRSASLTRNISKHYLQKSNKL